ncbi:hypothetical protein HDU83_008196 [Entophlyctis luteolus]|nr:hypothetical protein HDU83_008196 [Entophlyctis luteolus]
MFDGIHAWFGEGQFISSGDSTSSNDVEDPLPTGFFGGKSWAALDQQTASAYMDSTLLNHIGISRNSTAGLALEVSKHLIVPLLCTASLTVEGWIIAVLIKRPEQYAFQNVRVLFQVAHILAYLSTGSLSAVPLFSTLDGALQALLTTVHNIVADAARHTLAGICVAARSFASVQDALSSDLAWSLAVRHAIARAAALDFAAAGANECLRAWPVVDTLLSAGFFLIKLVGALWIGVLRFYYLLMLLACMYDVLMDLSEDFSEKICSAFEERVLDYN